MRERERERQCLVNWGPDKRAYITALRQAKFYLPLQAPAVAARVLRRSSTRGAAVPAIRYPSCTVARVLQRPTFKFLAAAVHEPQYTIKKILVYCGGAAVGIDVPQYKPFYTVPVYWHLALGQCFPAWGLY